MQIPPIPTFIGGACVFGSGVTVRLLAAYQAFDFLKAQQPTVYAWLISPGITNATILVGLAIMCAGLIELWRNRNQRTQAKQQQELSTGQIDHVKQQSSVPDVSASHLETQGKYSPIGTAGRDVNISITSPPSNPSLPIRELSRIQKKRLFDSLSISPGHRLHIVIAYSSSRALRNASDYATELQQVFRDAKWVTEIEHNNLLSPIDQGEISLMTDRRFEPPHAATLVGTAFSSAGIELGGGYLGAFPEPEPGRIELWIS